MGLPWVGGRCHAERFNVAVICSKKKETENNNSYPSVVQVDQINLSLLKSFDFMSF